MSWRPCVAPTLLAMFTALLVSSRAFGEDDAQTYKDRGIAHYFKNDYDRAIADYTKAIGLDPKYALAYHYRGIAYWRSKEYDRAIGDFIDAIRLDPHEHRNYNNLAWAIATCPKDKVRNGKSVRKKGVRHRCAQHPLGRSGNGA